MADSTTLLFRFLGIDEGAGAQFDKMAAKTAMLGDTSKSAFSKMKALGLGVGVAGAAVAVASIKMASDFQRSMTLIQTQAGASAGEVKQFSKALLDMAGSVGTGPEQLATSLYHVYSTGLRGAAALKAVKVAAEGAKIGNADLEETTNALTSTIASGIKGAGNYSRAMGTLIAIVGSGDMKLSDLNEALGTGILTAAKVFNVSLNQVGAALATFGDNNIRGADAATKLRMTMQDLAKPAAHADQVLAQVGLTSAKLRNDLAQGGLTKALTDLKNHMDAAGITAGKVGPFIENAFTKKAGVGLAILIEQMGRYNQKLAEGAAGAKNFGSDWQATTHTLAFALDRLKAEAQAAMISLGTRLLPAVTHIADVLGRDLPGAIARAQQILQPFEQIVGGALVTAFRTLGVVIKAAATVLSGIADVLSKNRALFTDLAVAVAGMWLAFKGFTIAKTALSALDALFGRVAARISSAGSAMTEFGAGIRGMSIASASGGLVMTGLGAALIGLTYNWQKSAAAAARAKEITQGYYQTLQQTKGAINNLVIAQVTSNLATQGTYEYARKLHVPLTLVTQAALGTAGAYKKLTQATSDPLLIGAAKEQAAGLRDASSQYKVGTQQAKVNAVATRENASAQAQSQLALRATANAAKQYAAALKQLRTDLQNLINTEISQMQTEDGFKEGLLQLRQQVKSNGDSLSTNTQKGLQNRDMLLSVLSSAEKAAEGSKHYGSALLANVAQFQAFAAKAGFSKGQVDNLLRSMNLMPRQIRTRLEVDTQGAIDAINNASIAFGVAGANAGAAYSAAFRASLRIRSPSKVFYQYGIWIVEGLIKGVKSYQVRAVSVAKELALGFISGWKNGTASLKDALVSPVQNVLERLTTVVDNAISRQQAALKKAQSNLKSLLNARASAISQLSGNISSAADLSGLFGTDANGNPTTANINAFLGGQAKQIENFAKDLKWGARHGLSNALLSEIANLGAVQGDAVLKEFMTGQASIRAANQSEAAIQRYSRAAATTVEDKIYAKAVAKDRKAVQENSRRLHELTLQLHRLERQAARAASVDVTINAKTGRPVVDKRFVDEIIKAIRRAERIAGRKLL